MRRHRLCRTCKNSPCWHGCRFESLSTRNFNHQVFVATTSVFSSGIEGKGVVYVGLRGILEVNAPQIGIRQQLQRKEN